MGKVLGWLNKGSINKNQLFLFGLNVSNKDGFILN